MLRAGLVIGSVPAARILARTSIGE